MPNFLAEKRELAEKPKEAREEFKDYYLKEEAERLRKAGFEVDDECRIKPSEFKKIFAPDALQKDEDKVKKIKKEWNQKAQNEGYKSYKDKPEVIKGETLEMAKILVFNGYWFNKKLISVRTAEYDDIFNGVDEIIFDIETKTPLAAIDETTNAKDKIKKLFREKMYLGGKIKYGLGFNKEGNIEKRTYEKNLPLFIIPVSEEELLAINANIIEGKSSFESLKTANNILQSLIDQSEIAMNSDINPAIKAKYQKAREIFEKL